MQDQIPPRISLPASFLARSRPIRLGGWIVDRLPGARGEQIRFRDLTFKY